MRDKSNDILYKGHRIEVWQDTDVLNPFEELDGNASLYCVYDRMVSEYNFTAPELSEKEKLNNAQYIFNNATHQYSEWHGLRSFTLEHYKECDFEDLLINALDDLLDNLEPVKRFKLICTIQEIPFLEYTSRGYVQSDWCDVFIMLDDEFFQDRCLDKKDAESILEEQKKLFDAWAWGDVYGYTIVNLDPEIVGDEFSCGNFFGSDLEESALYYDAKECIDYYIKEMKRQHFTQLKKYIRNHVPLAIRQAFTY